jgi:hypothetical protein
MEKKLKKDEDFEILTPSPTKNDHEDLELNFPEDDDANNSDLREY